ncbi:MAG: hypothetical protein AAF480_20015 [Actinomycetota bacterium]
MSDLEFESSVVTTYPDGSGAELTLEDVSSTAKTIVRAAADTAAAAALGVSFGASRAVGDALVLGQRPGEWMLLGDAAAFVAGMDTTGHVSVIDHTHSRALFRLAGAASASVLEKVCSLDWSDAMTPDGAVVSASIAKATCDLTRQDVDGVPSYLVACDRSFGQYLFDALLDAGDEFGIGVTP